MLQQGRYISVGTSGKALYELPRPAGEVGPKLLELWLEIQGGKGIPRREEFTSTDMAELMPNLYFIDILEGGADFTARFFGSTLVDLMGIDFTGLTFADVPKSERWRADVFRLAMERKAPIFYLFDLGAVGKPHYKTANTLLPALDSDGQFTKLLCSSEVVAKDFESL